MKKILYILLFLCFFASCKDNDEIKETQDTISLHTKKITLESTSCSATIEFVASKKWTITIPYNVMSWCKVSATSGNAGNNTLVVSVSENERYDERNASITIVCGTIREIITITQKQKDALIVNSNKIEINSEETDFSITAKTNISISYEIEGKAKEWISINQNSRTRGLSETTFRFTAKTNTVSEPRQGNIIIKGTNGLSETVTVYQQGEQPTLILNDRKNFVVASAGDVIKAELKSNVEYELILPNVDWIEEVKSRAISTYTFFLKIAPNESYDSREAELTVRSLDNSLSSTVTILQMQKNAIVLAKNTYEVSDDESILDLSVITNVDFKINSSVDWISEYNDKTTRGLEEHILSLKIEKNPTTEKRTGTVSLEYEDIVQKITIVQAERDDKMKVVIVHSETKFSPLYLEGKHITGNVNWGDGMTSDLTEEHFFTESGEKTSVFETMGVDVIRIDTLKSISSITIYCQEEKESEDISTSND